MITPENWAPVVMAIYGVAQAPVRLMQQLDTYILQVTGHSPAFHIVTIIRLFIQA